MHSAPARSSLAWIGALVAAALAALAYRGAITSDFTGGDTLALIEVSRIRSLDDLATMLTQPMLPIVTKFYRPTASFWCARSDHWIWGLDARGFHLSDVLIHAAASALVVLLVRRWSGNALAAFLAGATSRCTRS